MLSAGSEATVRKLRRSNLSEDAYETVRELLLSGKRYSPGQKISVEELSRELGVSRTPLWGAINRLEAEGIVEIVARQGVYLISYDPERAREIYETRVVLEGLTAHLAAAKINERQIAALKANIDAQRARLKKGDFETYYALALEFHKQIARIAGNSTLERLLGVILGQIQAMRLQREHMPTHLPQSCDDHEKLLQALKRRNGELAEKIAKAHIRDLIGQISPQDATKPPGSARQGAATRRRP
jgi:DNA-binding GntR family transcriptional regulator